MKKQNKSFKLFSVLVAAFLIFSSCQIGLGSAIDLQAPIIELTSHGDSDYVGQNFRLAGLATDNDKIKKISIDFDEADIHFIMEEGIWKKKTSYTDDWTVVSNENCEYSVNGTTVSWAVDVSTEDAKVGLGSTYVFSITVEDYVGNSSKQSKLEGSLIVDVNIPDISIKTPELFTTVEKLDAAYPNLVLNDGNVLAQLLNGDLVFEGRQDIAASFKEFRIELDDGIVDAKAVNSSNFTQPIGDISTESISKAYPFERNNIYFSKTLKVGQDNIIDLRTWKVEIPFSDWISSEKNPELMSGKHKIRVVATGISNSDTWQRKVLGYFVWYLEADKPWISVYSGCDSEADLATDKTYPSTKIFGLVQDDDGIKSLTYSLEKLNSGGSSTVLKNDEVLNLSEENAKNSQFNITVPVDSSYYKITVKTEDIFGNKDAVEKYYNVLDVQPPKIILNSPKEGSSVFDYSGSKIPFKGTVSDDGTVKSLKIAYLNPTVEDADNKIKYINHSEPDWNKEKDSVENLVFTIDLPEPTFDSSTKQNVYSFEKNLDLFVDLKISESKPLKTQDFVLLAIDNAGGATVYPFAVIGDSESPKITIQTLKLFDGSGDEITYNFTETSQTNLPVIKSGYYAEVFGTWNDNSVAHWGNLQKINNIKLEWVNAKFTNLIMDDGKWSVRVDDLPSTDDTLSASITDFGRNFATTSQSITVDKAEIGLDRIGSEANDDSYKAGDEIIISLEFTKSATFIGKEEPSLTLSNGGVATFDHGNNSSKMYFKYIVDAEHENGAFDVISVNSDECTWQDSNNKVEFSISNADISLLSKNRKTLNSRNILVDTSAPFINKIQCTSNDGYYKAGTNLNFRVEFNEPVNINNVENLKLNFEGDILEQRSVSKMGANVVLFSCSVKEGDNSTGITIKSINSENSKITDVAGNEGNCDIEKIPVEEKSFNKIYIDTTFPVPPTISGIISDSVITDITSNVQFELDGVEKNAIAYYTIDDGNQWAKYSESIKLTSNGTYKIKSKQIDAAGNESNPSETISITIDKGAILKKVSASNPNGTYKAGDIIYGYLEFRGDVTLPEKAYVTLNTGSVGSIKKPTEKKSKFYFDYKIEPSASIVNDGILNVESLNFEEVTYFGDSEKGSSQKISLPISNLASNKEIKILTGNPNVDNVELAGEDSNAVLTVTFDREISSLDTEKTITLTVAKEDFLIPTVLEESEMINLKVKIPTLDTYYFPGTNGAILNDDRTLTSINSKKYILDFDKNNNDSEIKELFIDAGLNKVSIPLYSSAITKNKKNLKIELSGEYELPIKGAEYEIEIPDGAIKDSVKNPSIGKTEKKFSSGVEKAEIRIQKSGYTIEGAGNTKTATASMPGTANLKISCRTTNAKIQYIVDSKTSNEIKVNAVKEFNTNTDDVTVPMELKQDQYTSVETTIGTTDTSSFDSIKGEKIAIWARSINPNDSSKYEDSYEYATKTVLKFEISSNAYDDGQGSNKDSTIIENDSKLKMQELQIWVIGGDNKAGANTSETFPLSWDDPSKFKLMTCSGGRDDKNMRGFWYWISWDINVDTFHGFVAGDVPQNADKTGPSKWYAGECSWAAWKTYYILHPGETLRMQIASGHDDGGCAKYFFRIRDVFEAEKLIDLTGKTTYSPELGVNDTFWISFDGVDISNFTKLKITAKFYDENKQKVNTNWGLEYYLKINNKDVKINDLNNINLTGTVTAFGIKLTNQYNNVRYVEISELLFCIK